MKERNKATIAALSTPPGIGAIGLIRMSGPNAMEIISSLFSNQSLIKAKGKGVFFGKISDLEGKIIDEVIVSIFRSPNSYTGEDVVEISCHGSTYIINKIMQLLISEGAVYAEAGEFTQRAFLNGKLDLSQAEAVADLISSETEASHRLAINQLKGGIKNEIAELRNELLQFVSLIELELDFSEEDVEFADREQFRIALIKMTNRIHQLLESFQLGNAVREGISTVIAGKPNAGKSTLLNSLLNESRALVSDIPGTTRDTIEERMNVGGLMFHFVDTAGIRATTDEIEQLGVDRTLKKIGEADVLIYVFDSSQYNINSLQAELAELPKEGIIRVLLANKVDLVERGLLENELSQHFSDEKIVYCSARDSNSVEDLKRVLYELASGTFGLQKNTIAVNARHHKALKNANTILQETLKMLDEGIQTDFLAQSIRRALHEMAEISGAIYTDEILESIFSKFCIGK